MVGHRVGAVFALTMALVAFAVPANARPHHRRAHTETPPTAIVSAFQPEFEALKTRIKIRSSGQTRGVDWVTGTLAGKPVVLMMSGVSMVNAAMNTQWLIDRMHVSRIVFSGIAGGVDPSLDIGDVVVPEAWAQPFEVVLARRAGDGFQPPDWIGRRSDIASYGMMFPRGVAIGGDQGSVPHDSFPADPALLATARTVAAQQTLWACAAPDMCLDHAPKIIVGGIGVSAPAFIDNAEYRQYLSASFHARVTDMETAAVAQVAYANHVPFIGFRSLSDLAGGDAGVNRMKTFMQLASVNSAAVVVAFVKALPAE